MNSKPPVDKAFSRWLVQRSLINSSGTARRTRFSIAIQSPCTVCQPRVANSLAVYLNEFDDSQNSPTWLPVTDHRLEQLQAHPEFREMLGHDEATDPASAISYLSREGGVILELPECHSQTADLTSVFQVSLRCQEPEAIAKARQMIHARLDEPISLAELAQAAGLSESHFCRTFKEVTKLTVTDYTTRARIAWARKELLRPAARISNICLSGRIPVPVPVQQVLRKAGRMLPLQIPRGRAEEVFHPGLTT